MGVREKLQRTPIRKSRSEVVRDKFRDAWGSIAGRIGRDDSSARVKAGAAAAGAAGIATAGLVAARKLVDRDGHRQTEAPEQGETVESVPQVGSNGERRAAGVTGQ